MSAGPGASPLSSRRARLRDFWSLVYQKSTEDNIFFMAGAISYNLLIAVVPLFLLAVGLWGYVLRARYGEPSEAIVGLLENYIPAMGGDIDLLAEIESGINGLVASRAGYSIVGSLLFIWLSTRLVSTLRIALREVFDIAGDRGVLRGKIFDLQVVVLGGVLLLLNVVITVVLQSLRRLGHRAIGHSGGLSRIDPAGAGHVARVHVDLGVVRTHLFVRSRTEDQLAHGMGGCDGHGGIVRVDEMGIRVVRHVRSRLPLRIRESRHYSRALVLDLLRVGSVCPQRRNCPGLHHAKSAKGAESACL